MIIFQFAPGPPEEKAKQIKIPWSVATVQKELTSTSGVQCPEAIAYHVMQSKDIPSKIQEIGKALVEINRISSMAVGALEDKTISGSFVQHPATFVKIAQATGESTSYAFAAIASPQITGLFITDQTQVLESFTAFAANRDSTSIFQALTDPKIAEIFVKNPGAFTQLVQTVTPSAFSVLMTFKNDEIAEKFLQAPETTTKAFVGISAAAGYNSSDAFQALATPKIAEVFIKDPEKVAKAFIAIATAADTNTSSIFSTLKKDNPAKLFAHDPDLLVRIAQATGANAQNAFDTLENNSIYQAFIDNPDKMVTAFRNLTTSTDASYAFNFLKRDAIAKAFVANPIATTKNLNDCLTAAGSHSVSVATALENDEVAKLFALHPDAFVKIAQTLPQMAFPFFMTLARPKIAEFFIKDPDAVVTAFLDIARVTGKNLSTALLLFENASFAEMFVKNPKSVLGIFTDIKAAGSGAEMAFLLVRHPKIIHMLVNERGRLMAAFASIADATGSGASWAFSVLANPKVVELFAQDPEKITRIFTDIAKAAGHNAGSAFMIIASRLTLHDLFAANMEAFVQLAKAVGADTSYAFDALANPKIAEIFLKDQKTISNTFVAISKAAGTAAQYAFQALAQPKIAEQFVQDQNRFVLVADATGTAAASAFRTLENDKIAELFIKDQEKLIMAFTDVVKTMNPVLANAVFNAIREDAFTQVFIDYALGRTTMDMFVFAICLDSAFVSELGSPLDELHDQPAARAAYLTNLSTAQVLGLLLSDPANFFTSSNHMLFDRLQKDIKDTSISNVFAEYDVSSNLVMNFMFRAINYGRFCGGSNCIFNEADIQENINILLEPTTSQSFDKQYYLLFANAMKAIKDIRVVSKPIKHAIESRLTELSSKEITDEEKQILSALQYLLCQIDPATRLVPETTKAEITALSEKTFYDPTLYRGQDGKVTIIQIFDKEDTEKDHWILTQEWGRKYGEPKKGESGELIYETAGTRIILFMGEEDENQKFLAAQLKQQPNTIVTFRGHSYSLDDNLPPEIFGNSNSHILFIPGSCGSAGSVAGYLAANQNTDLRTISNTSTGRGQVTNAILGAIIATNKKTAFKAVLRNAKIEQNGGDPATLQAWSSGEAILSYVYRSVS